MLLPASSCTSAPAGAAASTIWASLSPPSTPVHAPAVAQQAAPVGGTGAQFVSPQQLPCLPVPETTPSGAPGSVTIAQQPATAGPGISEACWAPPGAGFEESATCHSQHPACCVCGVYSGALYSSQSTFAEKTPVCCYQHPACYVCGVYSGALAAARVHLLRSPQFAIPSTQPAVLFDGLWSLLGSSKAVRWGTHCLRGGVHPAGSLLLMSPAKMVH